MSTFDSAIAGGLDAVRQAAGVPVVYSRDDDSVTLNATRGQSRFEQATQHGLVGEARVLDFLIKASDLVLDGVTVEPDDGDQIRETDAAGDTLVYEVRSPGGGEPAWRWSDPARHSIRVHTKHVDAEPAA